MPPPDPDAMLIEGGSWRLIRGIDIPAGATIGARFSGGTVTGFTGVNRYRAAYRLDGPSLRLGPAMTTKMAGDAGRTRAEQEFLTLFDAVAGYHVDPTARALVLVDDAGDDVLIFEAAPDVAEDLVGRWTVRLVRRAGELVPTTAAGTPHLAFDGSGQVTGSAGVNSVRGTARTVDERLYLGPLAMTRMVGTPDAMDEEAALMAALEDVHGYRIEDGVLTLLDADLGALAQLDRSVGAEAASATPPGGRPRSRSR